MSAGPLVTAMPVRQSLCGMTAATRAEPMLTNECCKEGAGHDENNGRGGSAVDEKAEVDTDKCGRYGDQG